MLVRFALPFALVAMPAFAECPEAPDISRAMDGLITSVQLAESEREARIVSSRMWAEWVKAPDPKAQGLLDEGMQRQQVSDLEGAKRAFDALITYCPDYAEGYNQRAFANFLQGNFAEALPDLDRAIALRPRHVAAIAGKGLTLISLERVAEGQDEIRKALTLNPWLAERRFLDMPTDPKRGGVEL